MNTKTKIYTAIGGAVIVGAAISGGAWAITASNQGALNNEYQEKTVHLETGLNKLATDTAALTDLTDKLTLDPEDASRVAEVITANDSLIKAVVADTEVFIIIEDQPAVSYTVLTEQLTETAPPEVQSGTLQSGEAVLPELSIILGEIFPTNGETQSSEAPQSASQEETSFVELVTIADATPRNVSKADVEVLDQANTKIADQQHVTLTFAREVLTTTYQSVVAEKTAAYDKAIAALTEKITASEKTFKDSDKKVADNKTRDQLSKALDAARKIRDEKLPAEVTPTVIAEKTAAVNKQIADLEALVETVNDSAAAKTKADQEAAAVVSETEVYFEPGVDYSGDYGYIEPDYGYSGGGSGGFPSGSGGGGESPTPSTPNPPSSNGGGGDGGWQDGVYPGGCTETGSDGSWNYC